MAQERHSRQDTGGTSGKRRIVVPLVLVGLAAGVVGLTIHMATREDASQGPDARGRPGDRAVGEWVKKIEDARFGSSRPETKTGVGPPPFGRSGTPWALQSADGSR